MTGRSLHSLLRLFSCLGLGLALVLASGCTDPPGPAGDPAAAVRDFAAGAAAAPAAVAPAAVTPAVPAVAAAADLAGGAAPAVDVTSTVGPRPALFVRSSRCGECHEKMRLDWAQSAHSHASRSPAYIKSLAAAGEPLRALCQSCHLPSLAYGQPEEQPGRPSEGVSCDGCHTISGVTVDKTQATLKFDHNSGAKYGPILGASGHYFHDMAYSVLHTKSELCAGCHHLTAYKLGDTLVNIPVVTSYSDWQRYGKGKQCQDCHMLSRGTEPVAKGAKPRPNVPAHVFPGAVGLGKQVRLELSQKGKPGEVAVEIQHASGHALPSGYVDRRLIVRAEFFAASGAKLATEDRSYGIKLVDAAGQPAPFFRAVRVQDDHRMIPGRPYTESFAIPVAPVGSPPAAGLAPTRATVSLLAAPTAPELSAVYGEPELTVLKSTSLMLPVRPGGK